MKASEASKFLEAEQSSAERTTIKSAPKSSSKTRNASAGNTRKPAQVEKLDLPADAHLEPQEAAGQHVQEDVLDGPQSP